MLALDLTTAVGQVRWEIADTSDAPAFSNAEITYAISRGGGTVIGGALVCIDRLLVDRARRASLFAEPVGGAPVPDDATAISALEAVRARLLTQAPVAVPTAVIVGWGDHPSDGNSTGDAWRRRCGC